MHIIDSAIWLLGLIEGWLSHNWKQTEKKFCDEWGVGDKLTVWARLTSSGWGVGWWCKIPEQNSRCCDAKYFGRISHTFWPHCDGSRLRWHPSPPPPRHLPTKHLASHLCLNKKMSFSCESIFIKYTKTWSKDYGGPFKQIYFLTTTSHSSSLHNA